MKIVDKTLGAAKRAIPSSPVQVQWICGWRQWSLLPAESREAPCKKKKESQEAEREDA